ncbi:AMP-binding protein [Marinobacterium nitratireducens]|uniref:AMP-binding protein n=1 Tax=Marinobacterium nitratireducens TaxID=518897 RepID=A0A918DRN3_9GAMM|nr:AMP-binding protein [Marinobacterium nitratireducens]GGO81327.1 AMP-binding protein [Marinobacterium nitratireducens]
MSMQAYEGFYGDFTAATIERQLIGSLDQGVNVCEEICDRWADGDRIGLYYEGVERPASQHSFAELQAQAARFANYLQSIGVGRGDRVAGLLPRTPELLVVILGTLRAGAVYQPLFTAFGSGAIEYRLGRAGTRLVVTDMANRGKLDEVRDCPPVLLVNADNDGDANFATALAAQSDDFTPVRIGADEPILQMFTSGTTGKAKGVAVPARALLAFYAYMRYAIDLRPEDRYWNVADPGWAYGLYYAVIGPLLLGCATHFNENAFTADSTYAMLRKYRISNLAAAPTAYRMLKAADDGEGGEPLGLRVASSAGEALNPEVISWVKKRLGCTVMDHYGQTETGMTCCNHHALEHPVRAGSMGYSLPGIRVVALDTEGREIADGEVGELAVDTERSPLFIFQGYTWGEKSPFQGRYYLTGDVVMSHGDGSFTYTGRDDDIITTAGYRVGPADVESALLEHPAVAESGVVGKPDPSRGAIIKAYVVIKPQYDAGEELADDLKQLVRSRLSTHAFPREIEFVEALPKTPSGKIQRFVLRNQAREESEALAV